MIGSSTAEKAQANEIGDIKKKIEDLRAKGDQAMRRNDLATAADLQHYAIPDLTARLERLEGNKRSADATAAAAGGALAGSVVTSDAIASIVSAWSGVPVTSLKVR